MNRFLAAALLVPLLSSPWRAQETLTPESLWGLVRVGGGMFSPDGEWIVFSQTTFDLPSDKGQTQWFRKRASGGDAELLLPAGERLGDLQWVETTAGARLFGVAKREDDEFAQVWAFDPATGGFARVTSEPSAVGNLKVAPKGAAIAFTRRIKTRPATLDLHPDLPHATGRIIDSLMYRHWDRWNDETRSHLHVAAILPTGGASPGVDLMSGLDADCPVPPFGGTSQIAWSPDAATIAFVMKDVPDWAQSTDSDIYTVDVKKALDGEVKRTNISAGMRGYDVDPLFSPDGRHLAWLSMERPGFEADRNRIMIRDGRTGAVREITAGLDQTAHNLLWHPDGASIYFMSEHLGTDQVFRLHLEAGRKEQVTRDRFNWTLRDISPDGSMRLFSRQSMLRPPELHAEREGAWTEITDANGEIYGRIQTPMINLRLVPATDGKTVHSWVLTPPGFDETKRYPLLVYFQGGPQGQVGQWFSYRWNFHLMAAKGYVVAAVNRRGLPGFGQAWNDQISRDWGGQAMQDILSVTDSLRAEHYIDRNRVAGVGASFGGYTAFWMMGNAGDRFASMIAHAGVFNLESMYGSTEELFFVDWDLGGPYWRSKRIQEDYDRFSPHRFVRNWKTPLLVIHGEKDYRVPVTQGMEAFTAAQVQGVRSRFLYFPDENHWILKPQNGVLWQRVFFDWLETTMPGGN